MRRKLEYQFSPVDVYSDSSDTLARIMIYIVPFNQKHNSAHIESQGRDRFFDSNACEEEPVPMTLPMTLTGINRE